MWQDFLNALGADVYSAHSLCLTNDPSLIALYVMGHLVTWGSYFVIGLALLAKRRHVFALNSRATLLFGGFILLCGLFHLAHTITLFLGVYRLEVAIMIVVATISAVTAVHTAQGLVEAA